MHKTVAAVCITLGILALPFVGYWCLIGLAFGAFDRDGPKIIALLLAGPLSVLPAGILGRKRPLTAGAWLVGGAVFSFFWHLLAIMGDGFAQLFRSFEAWIPVTVICIPMLLLGLAFFLSGGARILEAARALRKTPVAWRRIKIGAGIATAAVLLGSVFHLLNRPIWTVILNPVDGPSTRFSVDSREVSWELQEKFAPLFRNPPTAGKKVMGTYEVVGPMFGHGSKVRERYHCIVEVTPTWTTVYRNCRQLTTYETPESCMAAARRGGVNQLMNTMIANDSWPGKF